MRYHLPDAAEPESAATAEAEQTGPPPAEAAILYDLAQRGRIKEIRERITHLEQLGPEYQAFVHKLRDLARRYRSKEIEALVEPYTESGNDLG